MINSTSPLMHNFLLSQIKSLPFKLYWVNFVISKHNHKIALKIRGPVLSWWKSVKSHWKFLEVSFLSDVYKLDMTKWTYASSDSSILLWCARNYCLKYKGVFNNNVSVGTVSLALQESCLHEYFQRHTCLGAPCYFVLNFVKHF